MNTECTLQERSRFVLDHLQFRKINLPIKCFHYELSPPAEEQYILRMLIKRHHGKFMIPEHIEWCRDLIMKCSDEQNNLCIRHSFCYITIRSGYVKSTTDDEWHVDGFSTRISHIPEQNYIISNCHPTEYVVQKFKIPDRFCSLRYNINTLLDKQVNYENVYTAKENTVYCFDPYILHRRPQIPINTKRCFIRISFTPIEIFDINNTTNPLLLTEVTNIDGVKFRNKLLHWNEN
jgi:hypothetical protein